MTGNEDELDGERMEWKEVLIHGDPEGLKSLANLLLKLVDLNQDNVNLLPNGERAHIYLRPKFDLGMNSESIVVGRLDAKSTGAFYDSYIPKNL